LPIGDVVEVVDRSLSEAASAYERMRIRAQDRQSVAQVRSVVVLHRLIRRELRAPEHRAEFRNGFLGTVT
jgi:hypothetical protein